MSLLQDPPTPPKDTLSRQSGGGVCSAPEDDGDLFPVYTNLRFGSHQNEWGSSGHQAFSVAVPVTTNESLQVHSPTPSAPIVTKHTMYRPSAPPPAKKRENTSSLTKPTLPRVAPPARLPSVTISMTAHEGKSI